MLRNITRPTANRTTLANRSTLKTLTKSMLAITLCTAGLAHANDYSSVTFFGDSLTDGGYFSPIISGGAQFTTNPDDTWQRRSPSSLAQTLWPILLMVAKRVTTTLLAVQEQAKKL